MNWQIERDVFFLLQGHCVSSSNNKNWNKPQKIPAIKTILRKTNIGDRNFLYDNSVQGRFILRLTHHDFKLFPFFKCGFYLPIKNRGLAGKKIIMCFFKMKKSKHSFFLLLIEPKVLCKRENREASWTDKRQVSKCLMVTIQIVFIISEGRWQAVICSSYKWTNECNSFNNIITWLEWRHIYRHMWIYLYIPYILKYSESFYDQYFMQNIEEHNIDR